MAIVSPASPFSRDEFDRGVQELRRLGYQPVYYDTVFDSALFTSGSAELRAESFVRAWSDPDLPALIAVRGGYGSVHLLPRFDGWNPAERPKLFIAYSDNTSVMTWLTCHCRIPVIHGPMLEGRLAKGPDGYDERSFTALISGAGAGLELRPGQVETLVEGRVSGPFYGGTLSQLCASLGTPYAFNPPDGCVLFIEDVNERPYKIDRMLTQLRLAGVLGKARGVVFGEMRGCDEPGAPWKLRPLLPELLQDFNGPILANFPSGHTTGPCWSIPLGVSVTVDAATRGGGVVIDESPVE